MIHFTSSASSVITCVPTVKSDQEERKLAGLLRSVSTQAALFIIPLGNALPLKADPMRVGSQAAGMP